MASRRVSPLLFLAAAGCAAPLRTAPASPPRSIGTELEQVEADAHESEPAPPALVVESGPQAAVDRMIDEGSLGEDESTTSAAVPESAPAADEGAADAAGSAHDAGADAPTAAPVPAPAIDPAPAKKRDAVLRAPLLDLRHEPVGSVVNLLLEAAGGDVGQAIAVLTSKPEEGVLLPREKWFWDDPERRFLARLTRAEIDGLDLRHVPIASVSRIVEGDPIPLESDPLQSREVERFTGKVTRVEDESDSFLFVEMRDAENHYRRVYISPRKEIPATPGNEEEIGIEGVATRDERGALWVAVAVTRGEERIDLRKDGRVGWPRTGRLQGRWVSALGVLRTGVETADKQVLEVSDIWFLVGCERASHVVLSSADGGAAWAVPWDSFSWRTEVTQTNLTLEQVRECVQTIDAEHVALVGDPLRSEGN